MILTLEKKLNNKVYNRRFWKRDLWARISSSQFFDWMVYIDDDYLSEWEILKFSELYHWQL